MGPLSTLSTPLSSLELEELNRVLRFESSTSDLMTLDGLDGFATALAIGPVSVTPEEWTGYVIGTRESEFDGSSSAGQDQRLRWLLVRYMGALEAAIRTDPDGFMPVFNFFAYPSREAEESAVASWAAAFMFGIELYYDHWKPIFVAIDEGGHSAALMLGPMLMLAGGEHEDQELGGDERRRLKELVANSVSHIYRFWYSARIAKGEAAADIAKPVARIFTIRRHDRCPCGSGKEYRGCCGT